MAGDDSQNELQHIAALREHYKLGTLTEGDLTAEPVALFHQWFQQAMDAAISEPNAMTLATVNAEGWPSARIVLLKGVSIEGFEFYTNYNSRKAAEIEQNPHVSLVFLWKELERQVRINGIAEKVLFEKSQTYFQSRPRGSQIGAWASPQSQVIADRHILEDAADKIAGQYENVDPLPCPEHWGGYIVKPVEIEFWQGRPDRMHDRFVYRKKEKGTGWSIDRLAP